MSDCRKCADFEWCKEYEECGLFKQKQITNADRIRSMTDEELATFLYNFGDCPCFGVKFCERGTRCEDAVLMKLREPVDNGACSADETSEKVQDGE